MKQPIKSCYGLGFAMGLLIVLDGCTKAASQGVTSPPAIEGEAITGVLERIKEDIAYYYARENQAKKMPMPTTRGVDKCVIQSFDFNIDKVKVELNAIQTDTVKGELGLTIPFGPPGLLSVGPDVVAARTETSSQALAIDLFPTADPNFVMPIELMNSKPDPSVRNDQKPRFASMPAASPPPRVTPISDTLIALRNDLTLAAASKPCLETIPKKGVTATDQITMQFQVDKDFDANVGFKLLIVSIKPEVDRKNTTGNMLTISFSPITGLIHRAK